MLNHDMHAFYANFCPRRPGRLSAISVFLCKSVLYGAFVRVRRALNGPKRRFSARAVDLIRDDQLIGCQTALGDGGGSSHRR